MKVLLNIWVKINSKDDFAVHFIVLIVSGHLTLYFELAAEDKARLSVA